MLVNWKDEAVLPFQEAMPVAFQKLMRGTGVASSQFVSIKVVFSVRANGSEKLLFDRKKYSIGKEQESLCAILPFDSVTICRTSFGFRVYLCVTASF